MNISKKAFSLIELLISISIITIIGVVATTSYLNGVDKANNSKVIGDLSSIENSLLVYLKQTNSLPMPLGNQKFYSKDSVYEHSYEESFGVSGFFTNDILPKKYISFSPIDPKTNQYYGYGKTKDGNFFEISGVIKEENKYKSIVKGNWAGEYGPVNLIKEYSGPNFVENNSKSFFAYNPEMQVLTAKISTFSGELFVNNQEIKNENLNQLELFMGDKIKISTGGQANIYFSDGSFSLIGDNNLQTEIKLVNMNFKEENNIFTNIKIALNMGSIWTKASKLAENSEFEIYSQDSVAAVRGTIFGVRKDNLKTNIQLLKGIIEVNKINGNLSFEELLNGITKNSLSLQIINDGITTIKNEKSYLEITNQPKSIIISNSTQTNQTNEDLINLQNPKNKQLLQDGSEINQNIQLRINNIYNNLEKKEVGIKLNNSLKQADFVEINGEKIQNWQKYINNNLAVFTGRYLENEKFEIRFCDNFCTKKFEINLTKPIYLTNDFLQSIQFNGLEEQENLQTTTGEISQNIDNCQTVNFYKDEGFGCYYNTTKAMAVENMYKNILDRLPDKDGFNNWYNNGYTTEDFINSAIEKNEPNLKYKCDELNSIGYYNIKLDGNCIENNLFSSGYSVVAFAPFDISGDTEFYLGGGKSLEKDSPHYLCANTTAGETLSCNNTNSGKLNSITYNKINGFTTYQSYFGYYLGVGSYLNYKVNSTTTDKNLVLGDKFGFEISVRGNYFHNLSNFNHNLFQGNYFSLTYSGGILSLNNIEMIDLKEDLKNIGINDFYKIIIIGEKSSTGNYYKTTLKIFGNNNINKETTKIINGLNYQNIGIFQIYDVLDYLKIYKK